MIHAAGAAGSPIYLLWHTTSARAAAGQDVILGPELGTGIKEYTFPTMICDARGRVYVSYRRHLADDGHQFRWNAPLAAAPGGGVYAVWEAERRVFFRAIGEAAETSGKAAGVR